MPDELPWIQVLRETSLALQNLLGEILRAETITAPMATPLERLRQITGSPEMQWLQPLYALIADIDHALAHSSEFPATEAAAIGAHIRDLLTVGVTAEEQAFLAQYRGLLQAGPGVAIAHAQVLQTIRRLPEEPAIESERLHARHQWNERRRLLRSRRSELRS